MNEPKILILDIETFPNLYYAWRLWEGRALDVVEFSTICCWAAKWLGSKDMIVRALPDYTRTPEKSLIHDLWKLVDEADMLVAHNGRAFDFGRMNSQFIKWGFGPPSPTQKIDTKKIAKSVFGFDSNSLDNLCQMLGLGEKMNTGGYELWKQCMAGDPTAWAKMKKYNAHDVTLLEKLYLTLRPWTVDHPNVTLYLGDCPKCGSLDVIKRGIYRSSARVYQRYRCNSCGGWSKSNRSVGRTSRSNTNG